MRETLIISRELSDSQLGLHFDCRLHDMSGTHDETKLPPHPENEIMSAEHVKEGPSTEVQEDRNRVSFDGLDDPLNPINWPKKRKWSVISLISAMNLVMLVYLFSISAVQS